MDEMRFFATAEHRCNVAHGLTLLLHAIGCVLIAFSPRPLLGSKIEDKSFMQVVLERYIPIGVPYFIVLQKR